MTIEWWHWMVLGIVLVLLELAVPAFFLVWFGLGAIIVGLLLALAPTLAFTAQIVVWIGASLAFVFLWFRVFKANVHKTRAGLSKGQFAGEIGIVTQAIRPYEKGRIRFQKPILGAEAWEAIADEDIAPGDRVHVLEVEGNILRVARARR